MGSLILAALVEALGAAVTRAFLRQRLLFVAAAVSVIAIGFLGLALERWLSLHLGPPAAALVAGLALLLVALGLIIAASRIKGSGVRPGAAIAALGEHCGSNLSGLAQPLTIAALISGFLFAQFKRPPRESDNEG